MQHQNMDQQFSLDTVIELEALFKRRHLAALEAAEKFNHIKAIQYGERPGECLNIFPTNELVNGLTEGLAPVQFFIHGGFWRSLDAELFSFLARGFVPYGAMLVVIDYPLMPAVRMAELVESCRKALLWTAANCETYGADPDRIYISGNSAGGHLVAELMDRQWMRERGIRTDIIKGGTAISGIFDLEPVSRSFQNEEIQLRQDELANFSPLCRKLDIEAPMIVAVGGDETYEFKRQSLEFTNHLRPNVADLNHMVIPGTNHISVVLDALADPACSLNQAVRAQMGL